ncbi:unnamed protein product [Boreogadus saida]
MPDSGGLVMEVDEGQKRNSMAITEGDITATHLFLLQLPVHQLPKKGARRNPEQQKHWSGQRARLRVRVWGLGFK